MIKVSPVGKNYYRCQSCGFNEEINKEKIHNISIGFNESQMSSFKLCKSCINKIITELEHSQHQKWKTSEEAMKLNEYQQISQRTAKPHVGELVNYGLGIAGESGEVADLIKKAEFHGHEIPKDQIKKELGDVLWYLSQIARLAGLTLEEVATANIEKLMKRYPNGFSEEASQNREV